MDRPRTSDKKPANGRYPVPQDERDYNAPVTGSHPIAFTRRPSPATRGAANNAGRSS